MNILFIHNHYQQYGGEDVAVQLELDILQRNGHNTDVLYFDNDDITSLAGKLKSGIRSFYNVHSLKRVRKAIDDFNPDIIHVHNIFFQASPSVLYIAHLRKIPVVMTLHNYRLICANAMLLKNNKPCLECIHQKFPLNGIRNACYRNSTSDSALTTAVTSVHKFTNCWTRRVSKYIALTEFAKNIFAHSSLNLHESQISVKPNFVADSGIGLAERENFFLFVGRISQEKGLIQLLEAFSQLETQQLIIAGEGPLEEVLKQKYKTVRNINFLGKRTRSEVIDLMKRTKALIFPSLWYEGLPYTIIEALSAGTPVLASNLGAMSQMVVDGFNGMLFKADSSSEIIRTVYRFNHNPVKDLYITARTSYLENYHPDIHYSSIINLYESLISGPKKKNK